MPFVMELHSQKYICTFLFDHSGRALREEVQRYEERIGALEQNLAALSLAFAAAGAEQVKSGHTHRRCIKQEEATLFLLKYTWDWVHLAMGFLC